MLKPLLLATAMTVAVPALAQTSPQSTMPAPSAPMTAQTQAPTDATAPTTDGQTAQQGEATDPAATTPVQSAQTETQPASDPAKVSSVVDSEFATYDKDANGSLSQVEFAAWMDALKAKQPAGAKQAMDANWNDTAFAQADTDKSKVLSKAELTTFLSGGKAAS